MEIPKFNETFLPILEVLENGEILRGRDLLRIVEDRYYSDLPKEQLEQTTKSGDRLIENRIAWGKSYLKKGGFLHYPQRGFVQITEKGKTVKTDGLSLVDIHSDVVTFYKPEKTSSPNQSVSTYASPQDLIDSGFEKIEREVKDALLAKLKSVDPYVFEKIILILLKKMGYGDFIETSKSGDGGVDGIINEDQLGLDRIYIQAKRYNENKVRETDIRNFIGAMSGDTHKGIFVTTSTFDEKAKTKAHDARHKIILLDGSKLVDLMHKYNIGIQTKSVYELKALDNDFFDPEEI
jgi:restriction system protein